jgi:hypothetical protein
VGRIGFGPNPDFVTKFSSRKCAGRESSQCRGKWPTARDPGNQLVNPEGLSEGAAPVHMEALARQRAVLNRSLNGPCTIQFRADMR